MKRWLTCAWLLLSSAAASAAGIQVSTTPPQIVLGQVKQVSISIKGVPGAGAVQADVNVGTVEAVQATPDGLRLRYRPPVEAFPQQLCLMLWRAGQPQVLVVRIPLLGTTVVPIRTRRNSQVTLTVGQRVFGPLPSGKQGRLKMRVVVPPGVSEGQVEVVDEAGLVTRKPVPIRVPPYNLLALSVRRRGPETEAPRFQITVATAAHHRVAPRLQAFPGAAVAGERPGGYPLGITPESSGRFASAWEPDSWPSPGPWEIRAWLPGAPLSARKALVSIRPRPAPPPPPPAPVPAEPLVLRSRPLVPSPPPLKLRLNAAIAGGIMHNTGTILSPRISAELGADYPLGPGRIGPRLSGGVSWTSQDVTVVAGLDSARSSVLLIPLSLQLTYRVPLGPVALYATAGLLAQIIRSRTEGQLTGSGRRVDLAVGGVGLGGVDVTLGPGALFIQAGFQYSRLDNADLKLLAGGVIVESGYRLEFGIR